MILLKLHFFLYFSSVDLNRITTLRKKILKNSNKIINKKELYVIEIVDILFQMSYNLSKIAA